MAREKREQDTPLKERLLDEFYRFSFFQAVLLLELRMRIGKSKWLWIFMPQIVCKRPM